MVDTIRDKFFDAINETYDALLSAIDASETRGHRVSRTVLEEARKGEKELMGLARKWVDEPTGYFENLEAAVDAQARAQQRALELARDLLGGAGEYRREVQDALRRLIKANATATEATVEALRVTYTRAMERVRGTEEAAARGPRRVHVAAGPKVA